MSQYTNELKRFCSVYKSGKKTEMYLYLDRKTDILTLPDALLKAFGTPTHVLDMVLTPQKTLARVDAEKVLEDIASQGYFLQMPPQNNEQLIADVPTPKDSLNG